MGYNYSEEKNVQMLVSLLKLHNIKKIIVSPGTTNVSFVASVQQDSFFELYSAADERSAGYIACGLAAECGEPVVISCTGATASRNYMPALTEAYYRKLPVLAITSTRPINQVGHNIDQVIDRSVVPKDIARISVHIPIVNNESEVWESNIKINRAILELKRHGGGPVHIDLTTSYSTNFSVKQLPSVRKIERFMSYDELPSIENQRVGIFIGSHLKMTSRLTELIDLFSEKYNAVVLCDQTSNYKGKYGVYYNLISVQRYYNTKCKNIDLLIHIGDVSASTIYFAKEVWRVNPDGEIRDTFRKLKYVFEMEEEAFFEKYCAMRENAICNNEHYVEWNQEYELLIQRLKEINKDIPYSSLWIALNLHNKMPTNSIIHFGILNSLRCWNLFKIHSSILSYSNTGGFGIDGGVSSLIGASLSDPNRMFYGIFGDLAFFYDMNSLGNRHIGNNVRIMVVNNGVGGEFKNHMNQAQRAGLGNDADSYIAAKGHYGNKSKMLLKHYSEDLGFKYITASTKEEFVEVVDIFLCEREKYKPILFEVFIDEAMDTKALIKIEELFISDSAKAKKVVRSVLGDAKIEKIKNALK